VVSHGLANWTLEVFMMGSYFVRVLGFAVLLGIGSTANAQDSNQKQRPDVPLTAPKDGPSSGPQNMGSTGWTGGEGKSHTGVTEQGPPESGQPELAKGLDLKKDADKPRK
jgi:hypothetical protein